MTPENEEVIAQKKEAVAKKFASIIEPLEMRKKELEVKKEVFQFMRDVEDENIWMEEKMNLVTSEELGSSLQDVNMLIKKNKTLKGEIENHEHRIMVCLHILFTFSMVCLHCLFTFFSRSVTSVKNSSTKVTPNLRNSTDKSTI